MPTDQQGSPTAGPNHSELFKTARLPLSRKLETTEHEPTRELRTRLLKMIVEQEQSRKTRSHSPSSRR